MDNLSADSAFVVVVRVVKYVAMPGCCVCRTNMFAIHDMASLLFSPDVCTSFEKAILLYAKLQKNIKMVPHLWHYF